MNQCRFVSLASLASCLTFAPLGADRPVPLEEGSRGKPYANDVAYEVLFHYTLLGYAMYSDAFSAVAELWKEIKVFDEAPSEPTFLQARHAWQTSRLAYDRTEVFRFPRSPIEEENLEELINAWDVQAGVVEADIIGDPDAFPEISRQVLVQLSRSPEAPGVVTGWHVVEFLLWGPVGTERDARLTKFTDDGLADRRRAFLRAAMDLLVFHIGRVRGDWEEENYDNFAGAFLMERQDVVLGAVFTGISTLTREVMAGERLRAPLADNDPAQLLSRYSDTTTDDLLANLEGLKSIYGGTYVTSHGRPVTGDGFKVLVASVDAALAEALDAALENATAKVEAIPRPLGIVLAEGDPAERATVIAAAEALEAVSDLTERAKVVLGVDDQTF